MKRLISVLIALGLSSVVIGATTDNEIFLEQVGDTLTLTIDQIGYGNKFGGTIVSGAVATDMLITGTSITMNIDQIGNSNHKHSSCQLGYCHLHCPMIEFAYLSESHHY